MSPQTDVLPLLSGNIATPSIEVPHEDEVLEGRRVSKCKHEDSFQKKTNEDFYAPWMQWGFSLLLGTSGHADNSFIKLSSLLYKMWGTQ